VCMCVPTSVGLREKYEFVGKCQEVGILMAGLTDDPYSYEVIGLGILIHSNAAVMVKLCVYKCDIEYSAK